MIDALSFCKRYIELIPPQEMMILHHLKNNTFIGVGRPKFQGGLQPVVLHCKKYECLDGAGYYQECGGSLIEYGATE
jgi:hypothetical protein